MWNYDFTVPDCKKLRYIVHTDAKNEADDQFTIAHALMTDKLDVKGIIGAHFHNSDGRFPDGTSAHESYKEIVKIVDLMHLNGKYPIMEGSAYPLPDEKTPVDNEAVRFIIDEAMKDDPRPLYIGLQGAITDLASAILIEPRICDRMTAIWIGGGDYPDGGIEFNLRQDVNAVNVVFSSTMPVWQVTASVYKQFAVSLAELQIKVKPYGKIGKYLFEQMVAENNRRAERLIWPHGEIWGLGDEGCVAALMMETRRTDVYDMIPAPRVAEDYTYIHDQNNRPIRVYRSLDSRLDLEDLFAKLQINFPERDS